METKNLDVVYICKQAEVNEELRYSLRSIAENLPHAQVFIAGYMPRWVRGVHHINVRQNQGTKYKNAEANWAAACNDTRVSDDFIYFNDDFFVMKPITKIPVLHRGDLEKVIKYYEGINSQDYLIGMKLTRDILRQLGREKGLKSYALHIPMVMNKTKRLQLQQIQGIINQKWEPVHWRTLYGNFYGLGGKEEKDVKIFADTMEFAKDATFLSTSDQTFRQGKIGEFIRSKFPNKSKYEA